MSAAVVTGAAGAIGRAVATKLAAGGLPVICVDVSDSVADTCAFIGQEGGRAVACVLDLTGRDAPQQILAAGAELGGISILVNNAGITRDSRAQKMAVDDFRKVVNVDAVAPLLLAEALAPEMPTGAAIVNVASRAAFGNFGQANYVTAKSALIGATRALAIRWAPRLRVNAVAPGLVRTPMTEAMPVEVLEKLIGRVPAAKAAEPAEIAEVIDFLAGERSSYVTGQTLVVCGGRSIAG